MARLTTIKIKEAVERNLVTFYVTTSVIQLTE